MKTQNKLQVTLAVFLRAKIYQNSEISKKKTNNPVKSGQRT